MTEIKMSDLRGEYDVFEFPKKRIPISKEEYDEKIKEFFENCKRIAKEAKEKEYVIIN